MQIVRITDALPDDFASLRNAASAEGWRHMERLAADWASGADRYDKPGEALFAAFVDGELAGIGGVTREPSDPEGDALRARRVYVSQRFRKAGVGGALAGAIIQEAFQNAARLNVNAGRDSAAFWDHLGFARVDADAFTHCLLR